MPVEQSIPVESSASAKQGITTADIGTDAFLEEIMTMQSKPENSNKAIAQIPKEESEEQEIKVEENGSDSNFEKSENENKEAEKLEKRFKDSQQMIGRQANELGQLRKQNTEMLEHLAAIKEQIAQKPVVAKDAPYYEKLISLPEEAIVGVLKSDYISKNQLNLAQNDELLLSQARILQTAARTANDMIQAKMKPVEEMAQQAKAQKAVLEADAAWHSQHPKVNEYREDMQAFINQAYPDPNAIQDRYAVAHMAYVWAEQKAAQNTITNSNDKRVIAARASDGGTRAAEVSRQAPVKKDALTSEIESSWAKIKF